MDNQDAGYTEDTAPDVTKNIGLGSAGGSQNNAAYNNNTRRAYSKYLHGYGQWQKTGFGEWNLPREYHLAHGLDKCLDIEARVEYPGDHYRR